MQDTQSISKRKYDVIVYGATGFTGELVVEYLASHYSSGATAINWAVAGRSKQKLEQLLSSRKIAVDCIVGL